MTETPEPITEETSTEAPAPAQEPEHVHVITGETSTEAPSAWQIVDSGTVMEGTLTAAEAAEVLGVSTRRVRQFVQESRLDVARPKPLAVTLGSVERLAQERSTSGTVALQSASTGLQNLSTIVEVLRAEHAATLAALEARVSDVAAHRDSLTEQVQDLRDNLERERERVEELSEQVSRLDRRRWWRRS